VLEVAGLSRCGRFRDVSLTVRAGEIVGLAGLMGAGRTDVAHALYGIAPADAGEIRIRGRPVRIAHPRDALAHGLGLVSEDRREYGLVPTLSVKHNLTLASLRHRVLDPRAEGALADEQIVRFGIKAAGRDHPVHTLSGGNQQKVVLAKMLLAGPSILILDEPTRGIDIGAKAEMHACIRALAREGRAVLLISSELPELLALGDRLLVMREGALTAELDPRAVTQEEVLRHAMPESGEETS
jgi:ABC-type sugar transport system ATPase subunit